MTTKLKAVRLDENILSRLSPIMKKKKSGFSAVVTEALETYIAAEDFAEAVNGGYGAWSDKKHPELKDGSAAYVRRVRKGRR